MISQGKLKVNHSNNDPEINIENVVASSIISHGLDLVNICSSLNETEYDPHQFPALLYQQRVPRCLIILFNNGKLICTGSNDIKDTENVIFEFVERVKRCGEIIFENIEIEIQSIIASAELKKKLNINIIYNARLLHNAEISTDEINALIYRPVLEGVTCLIFPSGKIAFTGAKNIAQVGKILRELKEKL